MFIKINDYTININNIDYMYYDCNNNETVISMNSEISLDIPNITPEQILELIENKLHNQKFTHKIKNIIE
jgi:hypothetical protein